MSDKENMVSLVLSSYWRKQSFVKHRSCSFKGDDINLLVKEASTITNRVIDIFLTKAARNSKFSPGFHELFSLGSPRQSVVALQVSSQSQFLPVVNCDSSLRGSLLLPTIPVTQSESPEHLVSR